MLDYLEGHLRFVRYLLINFEFLHCPFYPGVEELEAEA